MIQSINFNTSTGNITLLSSHGNSENSFKFLVPPKSMGKMPLAIHSLWVSNRELLPNICWVVLEEEEQGKITLKQNDNKNSDPHIKDMWTKINSLVWDIQSFYL
jgi:hypothetical protein